MTARRHEDDVGRPHFERLDDFVHGAVPRRHTFHQGTLNRIRESTDSRHDEALVPEPRPTESNVLLLLLGDVRPEYLRERLDAIAPSREHVHVVAPMLVGPLDWLATAEDDAHRRAEIRALEAEWTLADRSEVEGEAGEADPVQAVEDALRRFRADAIVIAGQDADPDLEEALARFGLPIRRLQPAARRRSGPYRAVRSLAAGTRSETPFVLFVGVNAALLGLGIVLSLFILLILWLIGSL